MKNILSQLGIFALCSTLPLLVEIQPTQAASFEFSFILDGYGTVGNGSLSFTESPLTGDGSEEVTLSELPDASFQYLSISVADLVLRGLNRGDSLGIGYSGFAGSPSSVLFKFEDGDLTGMTFQSQVTPVDATFTPGGSSTITVTGNAQLSVAGANYIDTFSGESVSVGYDPFTGEFYNYTNSESSSGSGTVIFTTIEPIAAIPEPLTVLGTATALGFGVLFKKRLSK